jgi:hypothetical protein
VGRERKMPAEIGKIGAVARRAMEGGAGDGEEAGDGGEGAGAKRRCDATMERNLRDATNA